MITIFAAFHDGVNSTYQIHSRDIQIRNHPATPPHPVLAMIGCCNNFTTVVGGPPFRISY